MTPLTHLAARPLPWTELRAEAAATWAALTPLLAQAPRVRYSADGGENFPTRYERQLHPSLPDRPATIPVYNRAAGTGRLLALDLDVSRARALGVADPVTRVSAEAAAVVACVERCGGRAIVDVSPSGGRHVYVLFSQELPWTELYTIASALARRCDTIDLTPMSNPAGQIRVPGSPHKVRNGRLTGYMQLTMPLREALDIAARPCDNRVWERLHDELAVELGLYTPITSAPPPTAVDASRTDAIAVGEDEMPWLPRRGGRRAPRPDLGERARTGDWSGYRSRSECLLALLNTFAAAGWTFAQVMEEAEHGIYGGLVTLLEHRTARYRERRMQEDWRKAVYDIAAGTGKSARKSDTSLRTSTPPLIEERGGQESAGLSGENSSDRLYNVDSGLGDLEALPLLNVWQEILLWRNAVWVAERDPLRRASWGRAAPAIRMLLRAMAVAARLQQDTTPAFGVRNLARMSGLDHSTVAKHLKRLREEPSPLIERIVIGRGKAGDRYLLVIPDAYRLEAVARRWRGGRINTTHHALNLLGACPALVDEVLSTAPTGVTEIARLALLSRSATIDALRTLASLNRAERTSAGWVRSDRPLNEVAQETGSDVVHAEHLRQHQQERDAWHAVLASWELPAASAKDRPQPRGSRPEKQTSSGPAPRPTTLEQDADAPCGQSRSSSLTVQHIDEEDIPWPIASIDDIEGRLSPPETRAGWPPTVEPPAAECEALALLEHMLGARVTSPWRRPPKMRR